MKAVPLKELFRQLLDHPDVRQLTSATRADERLEAMLNRGWYTSVCRYWPTIADGELRRIAAGDSPTGILNKNTRPTPEVASALNAIADRYSAVFASLRSGLAVARGHLITGQSEMISAGIWSHPQFRIDFVNGDVGTFAEPAETSVALWFEARWAAVTIEAASDFWSRKPAAQDIRKKKKMALSRVERAVKALWPDGNLDGLPAKDRNRRIRTWLDQHAFPPVSDSTLKRYFANRD